MRACPKCQTNNEDSNNFRKKCGFKLSDSSFQEKKEKVLGEQKRKLPWMLLSLIIGVLASAYSAPHASRMDPTGALRALQKGYRLKVRGMRQMRECPG
jgi:hypothetical protein